MNDQAEVAPVPEGEAAVSAALEAGLKDPEGQGAGSRKSPDRPIDQGNPWEQDGGAGEWLPASHYAPDPQDYAPDMQGQGQDYVPGPTERAHVDGAGDFIEAGMPSISQLPPDAPVRALGTNGNKLYFLDAHSQLRELGAKDVNRTMILHLFGKEVEWIYHLWPTKKHNKEQDTWTVTGWDGTKAQESLMTACARRGIWRPQDHVRGRGVWEVDGNLVVHDGAMLHFSDGSSSKPGLVSGNVYPAAPRALVPAKAGAIDGQGAAAELLALYETWNWSREFDPRLLLGWNVAAMMGGALKVRPLAWVTGEKGTGKSSLVGEGGVVHKVHGSGILMTANTTAAGLYQKIEYDSLPVSIDEIEAKRGNQKTEAVIELARQAYSGGMVLRGGADHDGKEFRAMCPVLFGSILIPPLMPQDLSRLALLNLKPFAADAKEPEINDARLEEIGQAMMRTILDRWHEWPARFAAWHGYLRDMGHSGRASDQFGTLLAAADLVLCGSMPDEEGMAAIAGGMAPVTLKETQVESSNADRCIQFAMSKPLNSMRGGEHMLVSELVVCAVRRFGGSMENPIKPVDAVRYLERAGVSVVAVQGDESKYSVPKVSRMQPSECDKLLNNPNNHRPGVYVAFAPNGDGILELFRGSDWEGVAGAHNPYVQALERVHGAWRAPQTVRIGGQSCRPILIPIEECVDVPSEKEAALGTNAYD